MRHVFLSRTINEGPAVPTCDPGLWLVSRASRFTAWTAGIILAATLTACGGGSSSGGGSETGEVVGDPGGGASTGNPFAGTYNGVATGTISTPGLPAQTSTGSIQFVVDARGNVTSDPDIKESGTGKLNGNSFTVTIPGARFNQPGLTCGGSVLLKGTISGNTISGTISGSGFTCNGLPFRWSGTFSATRTTTGAVSRASRGGTTMEAVRESLRKAR